MSKKILVCFLLLMTIVVMPACKKLIRQNPITEVNGDQLFSSDQSATSVVLGITTKIMEAVSFFNGQGTRNLGLYGDELIRNSSPGASDLAFFNNDVKTSEPVVLEWWNTGYYYVYCANSTLEKLERSTALSTAVKQQLQGETRFLRALVYFYLVNLYGQLPLVLVTDPAITSGLLKSPEPVIYNQVISDLLQAYAEVEEAYPVMIGRPSNRCRVNKATVSALLAKAYLYVGNYANAALYSSRVINDAQYRLEADPDKVFLAQSAETIFGLYPTNKTYNTSEGRVFLSGGSKPLYILTDYLLQRFEALDGRLQKWTKNIQVTSGTVAIPYKYKVFASEEVLEYTVLLRLADMYMVRAEAYWAQGNLPEAIQDVNKIRGRAGLSLLPGSLTVAEVREAIERENQLEFFAELGHRFLDLKRWSSLNPATPHLKRADDVFAITKPGKWKDYMINLPIPRSEVQKSAITQNPGYTD